MENLNEYAVLVGSDRSPTTVGEGAGACSAAFPYGKMATRSDSGRVRKERFAPRAFSFALREKREVHLLSGHDLLQAPGLSPRRIAPPKRFCDGPYRSRPRFRQQRSSLRGYKDTYPWP